MREDVLNLLRTRELYFRRILIGQAERQKAVDELFTEISNSSNFEFVGPTLRRLVHACPFPNLQLAAEKLLQQTHWDRAPPLVSYFMPNSSLVPISDVFVEIFLATGRISHLDRLLAWHPSYYEIYLRTQRFLMTSDGPLPLPWRHYLALLAAAEMRCPYLVSLQQIQFLSSGGDTGWLRGITHVPPKLLALETVNQRLAHRPWLIQTKDMSELLQSGWSVSELVHAMVILATYHSLSCFCCSLGISPEPDVPLLVPVEEGWQLLQQFEQPSVPTVEEESEQEDTLNRLVLMERDTELCMTAHAQGEEPFVSAAQPSDYHPDEPAAILIKYLKQPVLQYIDFDVRSDEYRVLHTEDFSWEDHAFSIVNSYLSGAGPVLDQQFKEIFNLTYHRYGHAMQRVDTSPFRGAIWHYVHRLFGVCHDDYNYHEVNVFISRSVKRFVKKVACLPWQIQKEDFSRCGIGQLQKNNHQVSSEGSEQITRGPDESESESAVELTPSEKCHVALLSIESRKQATLMYAMKAIMEHMN